MTVFAGAERATRRTTATPAPRVVVQGARAKAEPEADQQEGAVFSASAFGDAEDEADEPEDLSQLSRQQLVNLAEGRGLTVPSRANKAQIVAMLEG